MIIRKLFFACLSLVVFASFFSYAIPTITFLLPMDDDAVINENYAYINITSDENLNLSLIEWGNSSGFSNITMDNSSTTNWYINMTNLVDYAYNYTIWAQNTTGYWNQSERRYITINTTPFLLPTIIIPQDNTYVAQNRTFIVNASVICKNSNCSNITARVRYNETTSVPNENISTIEDIPFYIIDGINHKNCSNNPLQKNDVCYVEWTVNATADLNSVYELDVIFESDNLSVAKNDTSDSTVESAIVITITTHFEEVDFGLNDPGDIDIAAPQNNDYHYNVSIDSNSGETEYLWIKGENLTNDDGVLNDDGDTYNIPVYELKWNIFNAIATARNMSESWQKLNYNNIPLLNAENKTLFWWINIPYGIAKGGYSSLIYFMANCSYS
ncbi:MAG: hypothetical protein KAQ92_07995 [Candidatus Aenigmarchaeota archaeon]|nr:hypothetical protein [Candidatus Aenigmarchaeota archaeon]MCK5476304.1 hypothetical protein [Candidatus Aenigmarchaeota archaeon]